MIYAFEPFRLNDKSRELFYGDCKVDMTEDRFEILLYLLRHKDRPVSCDEFIKEVKHNSTQEAVTVRKSIERVRALLKEYAPATTFIETVHRGRYHFIAPCTVVGARDVAADTPPPDAVAPDITLALQLRCLLEDRRVLTAPWEDEYVTHVRTSIQEIRQELREMIKQNVHSAIRPLLQELQTCCRTFASNSDKAARRGLSYSKCLRDFRRCFADILETLDSKTPVSMQSLVQEIRAACQ